MARERVNINAEANSASTAPPNRSGRAEKAANGTPKGSTGISVASITARSLRQRPNSTTAPTVARPPR